MMGSETVVYGDAVLQRAYELGRDCGINGPSSTNCNFRLFALPAMTKAWEQGKADAERSKP